MRVAFGVVRKLSVGIAVLCSALFGPLPTSPAAAQTSSAPSFRSAPTLPVGSGKSQACCATIGDFNGDGVPDVATVDIEFDSNNGIASESVVVFLANGDGTFQAPVRNTLYGKDLSGNTIVVNPSRTTADQVMAAADFDGDGKSDLLVLGNGGVYIFPSNLDGTFQNAGKPVLAGGSVGSLIAYDFDGDGRPDFAIDGDSGTLIYSFNSQGVLDCWKPGPNDASTNGGSCKIWGAIGYLAVARLSPSGPLALIGGVAAGIYVAPLNGNGNATLYPVTGPITGYAFHPQMPAVGDYNGDGYDDLALAPLGGTAYVYLNNGSGSFAPAQALGGLGLDSQNVAAGDFNGDGSLDFVVGYGQNLSQDGFLSLLVGNGDGNFKPPVHFAVGSSPYWIASTWLVCSPSASPCVEAPADFNRDAKPDVVTVNTQSANLSVLLSTGSSNPQTMFAAAPVFFSAGSANNGPTIVTTDINGDGKLDLLVSTNLGPPLSTMLGRGDGSFQAANNRAFSAADGTTIQCPSGASGCAGGGLTVGDFNGDGKPDVAQGIFNGSDWSTVVMLGGGGGTFTSTATLCGPQNLFAGDYNRDGWLDLLVMPCDGSASAVYLGHGDGSFGAKTLVSAATGQAVMGDFNGDGIPDLVLQNPGTVYVALGNGDGSLQSLIASPYAGPGTQNGTGPMAVGDFDGDGKLDLAVALYSSNNPANNTGIKILKGNGDGSFAPPTSYPTGGAQPNRMAAADLNGDGKLDLIVAYYEDCKGDSACSPATALTGGVSILAGNGDGSFQPPVLYAAGINPYGITVGDFNGDGKPDLAIVDASAGGPVNPDACCGYAGRTGFSPVTILLNTTEPGGPSGGGGGGSSPAATTTTIVSSLNPSITGDSVTFTATVTSSASGTVTGSVNFYVDAIPLGSATLSGGSAAFTTSALTVGSHSITASYSGDSNFADSTSAPLVQVVNALTGQCAPPPSGMVSWWPGEGNANDIQGGNNGTLQNGATFGNGFVGLAFSLDGVNDHVDIADAANLNPTTAVTLAAWVNPQAFVKAYGAVIAKSNAPQRSYGMWITNDGRVHVEGSGVGAAYAQSAPGSVPLNTWTHVAAVITAGQGFAIFVNGVQQTIVAGSGTPGLTATTVPVMIGDSDFGYDWLFAGLIDEPAIFSRALTAAELQSIVSAGNAGMCQPGSGPSPAATTTVLASSKDPSRSGDSVTFTATVNSAAAGTPTGTMMFYDGTSMLGTAALDAAGQAAFTTTSLTVGGHAISANYGGDIAFSGSTSSPFVQTVLPAVPAQAAVQAWGSNLQGQLCDGTTSTHGMPEALTTISDVVTIASGSFQTAMLKSDGTVWACGDNSFGELGNGTFTNSATPVQASALSGVVAVAVGANYSLALKSDGTVWAWGANFFGQLGNGTSTNSSSPVRIASLSGIVAIASGNNFGLALKNDSTVWAWGENFFGELGDGTTITRNIPGQVGNISDVVAIAAGVNYGLAIKRDGTVWGWGQNDYGQLGNGTFTNTTGPVQASGIQDVTALAGGGRHTLALRSDGTVWAWGENVSGQLGIGSFSNPLGAPQQTTGISGVVSIAAGFFHSMALKGDGTAWVWGSNSFFELGNGTVTSSNVPLPLNIPAAFAVAAGAHSSFALTAALAATSTMLTSSQNPSDYGQNVIFTANVSSASGVPSGTVQLLEGTAVTGVGPLDASGQATFQLATSVGTHSYVARYLGDSTHAASASPALNQVVNALATTTSLASSQNPSTYGQNFILTATVSSASASPTGTVQLLEGSVVVSQGTLDGSGQTTFQLATSVGPHTYTAAYLGDSTHAASTSVPLTEAVNQALPTVSVVSSLNPSVAGQAVTFTATVSSPTPNTTGVPTGTVSFYLWPYGVAGLGSATNIGTATLSNGVATLTTSTLPVGSDPITVTYNGDSNFAMNQSPPVNQVVLATTTTTAVVSPNPVVYGQAVSLTMTVSSNTGVPTGTVNLYENSLFIAAYTLDSSGQVKLQIGYGAGSMTIVAAYNGDSTHAPSTSPAVTLVASKATTTTSLTLTSGTNPSVYGQLLVFTAAVTGQYGGTVGGTVTFMDGSTTLGTAALSFGNATFSSALLPAGTHSITAVYNGDANNTGSTSVALSQTVNKAATASTIAASPNPSYLGQPVTFTATVASSTGPIPTGSVNFKQGSTVIGTATLDATGHASFTTSALAPGNNNVTAAYGGGANFLTSTSASVTEVVNKTPTTTTVVSSQNPSVFKQPLTFTATVVSNSGGMPTGSVTFYDGNQKQGSATLNSAGQATFATSGLGHGSHNITAVYGGDNSFASSTSSVLVQMIN